MSTTCSNKIRVLPRFLPRTYLVQLVSALPPPCQFTVWEFSSTLNRYCPDSSINLLFWYHHSTCIFWPSARWNLLASLHQRPQWLPPTTIGSLWPYYWRNIPRYYSSSIDIHHKELTGINISHPTRLIHQECSQECFLAASTAFFHPMFITTPPRETYQKLLPTIVSQRLQIWNPSASLPLCLRTQT